MPRSRIAVVKCALDWQRPLARHGERVYFEKLNVWRNFLPGRMAGPLASLVAPALLYAMWGSVA